MRSVTGVTTTNGLDIGFPPINTDATRKRVEQALETARVYKQVGFVRRETKLTASYEVREPGKPYSVGKPVESAAVWNVDTETRIGKMAEDIELAVESLEGCERDIVRRRYLDKGDTLDYMLCYELGMSERTYRRHKAKALFKLAWMLGLEVPAERGTRGGITGRAEERPMRLG